MRARQLMAIGLAAIICTSSVRADDPPSGNSLIAVNISGETLAEIFGQLARQYGYTVSLPPGGLGNRRGPDMTVSPLPAARALAVVAAAYGACAVVDGNFVHVAPCE